MGVKWENRNNSIIFKLTLTRTKHVSGDSSSTPKTDADSERRRVPSGDSHMTQGTSRDASPPGGDTSSDAKPNGTAASVKVKPEEKREIFTEFL